MLDSLLTVCVIHQLVVFYWRGAWNVLDIYLYPDNRIMSAVISLAASYVLQLILCIVQPLFNSIYVLQDNQHRMSEFCRRWLLEAVIFSLSNLVCVGHWRGVWMLLDIYVYPENPDTSAALTHIVGIVGLWLILAGHSVTLAGCPLDGGSELEQGCLIRNQYVRYFVDKRQAGESVLCFCRNASSCN